MLHSTFNFVFPFHHPLLSRLPLLPPLILHPNRIRRLRKLILGLLITPPRTLTRAPGSFPLRPLLLPLLHRIMLHIRFIRLIVRVLPRLSPLPLPLLRRTTQQSRCPCP